MKILSEREYYEFPLILGVICLILGLIILCAIVTLILDAFKEKDFELFLIAAFFIVIDLTFFVGFNESLDRKVNHEYKATITDFNEVHDKGYEIVDREGKIYTLVKTKK